MRFKQILFLFLFTDEKYAESWLYSSLCPYTLSMKGGPHFLDSSPGKGSIFITSAPKSDKFIVPKGPTIILERSKTRIWLRIGFIFYD